MSSRPQRTPSDDASRRRVRRSAGRRSRSGTHSRWSVLAWLWLATQTVVSLGISAALLGTFALITIEVLSHPSWEAVLFWSPLSVALFLVFLVSFWSVASKLWRRQPISVRRVGHTTNSATADAVAVVGYLWIAGFWSFVTVTVLLTRAEYAQLAMSPRDSALGVWSTAALYLWHLLDAVPWANITETVRWREPGGSRNWLAGVLLVMYKLMVLTPVVAALRGLLVPARDAAHGSAPAEPESKP
jgi:hypothetical protein